MSEPLKCHGRVTRSDGTWLPCDRRAGHGIDKKGFGCGVSWQGGTDPKWNPRDIERRKCERRNNPCDQGGNVSPRLVKPLPAPCSVVVSGVAHAITVDARVPPGVIRLLGGDGKGIQYDSRTGEITDFPRGSE